MKQYILKSALVAEIEKLEERFTNQDNEFSDAYHFALKLVLSFIDTLEVKDVDEIIKNAEDHAFFAGSENTREKLINEACKWWEVELIFPSMTQEEIKLYKSKVRRFRKDMEDE